MKENDQCACGTGVNFWVEVEDLPGGVQPAPGAFRLVDDDLLKDGDDVPMPDTSTLEAAMAEAYVQVLFDVGDSNNDVTFDANLQSNPDNNDNTNDDEREPIIAANWTSRSSNSEAFWVVYLLGAFQDEKYWDMDGESSATMGLTPPPGGGCLIFTETLRDKSIQMGWDPVAKLRDTVVHEIGHAVGISGSHPVTEFEQRPPGQPPTSGIMSKYTPEYLNFIRSSTKPRG